MPSKKRTMKTKHLLVMLAAAAISSCSLVEDNMSLGHPHIYGPRNGTRTGQAWGKDSTGAHAAPQKDTLVYLSAVRFPVDYDWKKDSAYGAVEAELVLMRNCHEVLSIPVGAHVSAAADRHHIVDGHLVTEFQSSSMTYIGIDGQDIVTMEGRHKLMGLLQCGDVTYTLTRPMKGEGFCLMADGQKVLSSSGGQIYGSMTEPSYRPNGALYLDKGKVCFCFSSGGSVFKVIDGKDNLTHLSAATTQDMRIIDGAAVSASAIRNGQTWQNGRVWPITSGYAISGIVSGTPTVFRSKGSIREMECTPDSYIYLDEDHEFALEHSRDGTIKVAETGSAHTPEGKWYFFSPRCACMGPSGPALALTPMGEDGEPVAVYEGKSTPVSLNGFLTGIEITIEEN